jgi:hypothetical protein
MFNVLELTSKRLGALTLGVWLAGLAWRLAAQSDEAIYTDSLQNGWQDWGWTRIDYANPAPAHAGSHSISVTITNAWQAIYLHHTAFDSTPFTNLTFWANGGASGGQRLQVQAQLGGAPQPPVPLPTLPANAWLALSFSMADLNVAGQPNFDGFWIQDRVGSPQPTFYLDDLKLGGGTATPPATNAPVSITIDALKNRHPISELIYGVAFASSAQLADLNCPLNRSGGNAETRYNWQLNAHNRAADFYFESIGDSPAVTGAAGDNFVAASKGGGAEPILTVPLIGWVAKLGANRGKLASYSIAKYGPQMGNDAAYFPDAGNGVSVTNRTPITWNDPTDSNVLTDSTFQQNWIAQLTNRWGMSVNGGVRYYCLDNEPSIWHSTHRDVHPVGATMQEIRDRVFDYAAKLKAVDPSALVLAPEEWGWSGYLYSGLDQQWAGAHNDYNPAHFPDRKANGGWDYLPWLLDQARQRAAGGNQRLLDVLTVHCYPQGGEFGDDTSSAMQLRRNQSTRSLWDPSYVDTSWINAVVKLIPRLHDWVATYYPGTKIGITEYNWGAENHINGATAQADILGIFGREALDYATRWTAPGTNTPVFKAIQMYRSYDDHKSTFGDISVAATAPNPDNLAAFAADRSIDRSLTVMLIDKQLSGMTPANLTLTNWSGASTAQVWQLTAANRITRLGDISLTGSTLHAVVPAQSITLFVLPAGSTPRLRTGVIRPSGAFDFWLDGQVGQRYLIQASGDLANWSVVQTNTLANSSLQIVVPVSNAARFYRAQSSP